MTYSLIEEGQIHTSGLSKEDAEEMLKAHESNFPDLEWSILPDEYTQGMDQGETLQQRQERDVWLNDPKWNLYD